MFSMKSHNRAPFLPKIPGTDLCSGDVPVAIIYRPARSARQAGPRPRHWVLEFEPTRAPVIEPLMGWTASADPYRPIRLTFPDRESAVEFAERNDWRYILREDRPKQARPNPWAGISQHRLHNGADVAGSYRITPGVTGWLAHRLHRGRDAEEAHDKAEVSPNDGFDPVLQAARESFPASDPPA